MATSRVKSSAGRSSRRPSTPKRARFEPAKIDLLFSALDGIAWMDAPTCGQIAQFAGIDPRTAGKLLKNALEIGLVDAIGGQKYVLVLPYPYKGTAEQKRSVVREALVRMPLLTSTRQFMSLGDTISTALRKAATINGVSNYDETELTPLINWANSLDALSPGLRPADLVDEATESKTERHKTDSLARVAFLSHSSKDKPFVRQLAADLTANGIHVWIDEQRIRVGDSIPERVAQGLAESDFFLIVMSENSAASEWVRRELNAALVKEIQKRNVRILPVRLDDSEIPPIIADKKYADFSTSYKTGLDDLLRSLKRKLDD